jgi:S-adenosyl-L-methionine hydrolase (adenosine-forming)
MTLMADRRAIVALLTDFGNRDPYVAAMKGVIAARTDAVILDMSHEIAPFDVFEAARFLASAAPYYPSLHDGCRSVFVCVIDPGVGSSRRIIAAEHEKRFFLAPDNGLLSMTIDQRTSVVAVTSGEFFLPNEGRTFHGRDRFAPVAAALASGEPLHSLGPRVAFADLARLQYAPPQYDGFHVRGSIVAIDRFGNLITDIEGARLHVAGADSLRDWVATSGAAVIGNAADTYEEMTGSNSPFLIIGSGGTVEISATSASAAELLHLSRFDQIELNRKS